MTPEQRRRAGRAVAERIAAMSATPTAIARTARVSPNTLLAVIRGQRWPSDEVQARIEDALGWRSGGLTVRAVRGGVDGALDGLTDLDLATELARRLSERDRALQPD